MRQMTAAALKQERRSEGGNWMMCIYVSVPCSPPIGRFGDSAPNGTSLAYTKIGMLVGGGGEIAQGWREREKERVYVCH